MNQKKQVKMLSGLAEGDVFEYGELLSFDTERLAWRCEEIAEVHTEGKLQHRYTFHVYFRGVMLRSAIAMVDKAAKRVVWGAHGSKETVQ